MAGRQIRIEYSRGAVGNSASKIVVGSHDESKRHLEERAGKGGLIVKDGRNMTWPVPLFRFLLCLRGYGDAKKTPTANRLLLSVPWLVVRAAAIASERRRESGRLLSKLPTA